MAPSLLALMTSEVLVSTGDSRASDTWFGLVPSYHLVHVLLTTSYDPLVVDLPGFRRGAPKVYAPIDRPNSSELSMTIIERINDNCIFADGEII